MIGTPGSQMGVSGRHAMELEHAVGYRGGRGCTHVIPNSGRYVYVAGGCAVLSDLDDFHNQTFLRGHDDDITAVKVSEDGRTLVTGQRGRNADVCLWDLEEHRVALRLTDHEKGIEALGISPDGRLVATVGEDRRLIVWDTSNGGIVSHTSVAASFGIQDRVIDVIFGGVVEDVKRRPTSSHHLCVVGSNTLLMYYVDPYEGVMTPLRLQLQTFQRRYTTAKYSQFCDLLLVGAENGDIGVVSTTTGAVVHVLNVGRAAVRELIVDVAERQRRDAEHSNGATMVSEVSTNGGRYQYARLGAGAKRSTTMFVGCVDGSILGGVIRDHNDATVEIVSKTSVDGPANALSIVSLDVSCAELLVGTATGSLFRVKTSNTRAVAPLTTRVSDACSSPFDVVVMHPNAVDRFFTASRDGIMRTWDMNTYHIVNRFQGVLREDESKASCTTIVPIPSLDVVLSAWSDATVRCHDMLSHELLWKHCKGHRSKITSLCCSADVKFFVTGSEEGEIKVWDTRTRDLLMELKEHRKEVVHLELLRDGAHLVSASRDRSIFTWNLQTGKRVAAQEVRVGGVTSLAVSPLDDTSAVTTGTDHKVTLWDLRQTQPVTMVDYAPEDRHSEAYGSAVRWAPNGGYIVTGGTDEVVKMWEPRTLAQMSMGYGHSGAVTSVSVAPDSRQVVSCGADACCMVWNVYPEDTL